MAELGEDEGTLGNDFAMGHRLTVRPHEAAVYLPATSGVGREDMGECLPCAVRSITEVRAITEEAFAVGAVERLTQVSVIVSATNAKGTVMVEAGPGPLGLCPVRGVAEVDRDTKICLVNLGSQPVEIEGEQVVTMAERVSETAWDGTTPGWYNAHLSISRMWSVSSWRWLCCPAGTCSRLKKGTWDG